MAVSIALAITIGPSRLEVVVTRTQTTAMVRALRSPARCGARVSAADARVRFSSPVEGFRA